MAQILSEVITGIANEEIRKANSYGISIINLPEIDYNYFVQGLKDYKKVEIYFLGYGQAKETEINKSINCPGEVSLYFTVPEAENSRNNGDEEVFRIHFLKNSELEMTSSLRWYDKIDVDLVYKRSCRYVLKKIAGSNETFKALLQAIGRKDVRELLNFERVLDYLDCLLRAPIDQIPETIETQIYRLGLLNDPGFCVGNPGFDKIKDSIKQNYDVVRRIQSLERNDKKNLANYSSSHPNDKTVRMILEYYASPTIELLKKLRLEEVQACLKAASKPKKPGKSQKKSGDNQMSAAASLMFEGQDELIDQFIDEATKKIDERSEKNKPMSVSTEIDGKQIDFQINPTTEKLVETTVGEDKWGEYIYADVGNPQDAIDDSSKYEEKELDCSYLGEINEYLGRAKDFDEARDAVEAIEKALQDFLDQRKNIFPYTARLQDMPMLIVLQKSKDFIAYLESYERLIFSLKDGYSALCELDSQGAKQVISAIVSLDFVFVIGKDNSHAMPTPLNPLYLWKYIKLAQEIKESRDVSEGNDCFLSEDDKDFIIRKAEEIPDPLALVMLPRNNETTIECLPYAGRIGNLPIYSSTPQISDSRVGMDAVCQNIVRYMCLYPHSSMMLHLCFVNPPTVELVVSMLKNLDENKDFSSFDKVGIDLTIYRTKETSGEWIEIQDKALNEGILGKIKGKNSENFYLSVKNKVMTYAEIIDDISKEQHLVVIFDPNERNIKVAKNDRNVHIHPLCVPKVYEYNKMRGDVSVRHANEGGVFSDYATIIEKLYDQPSTFGHRDVFVNTPLRKETYSQLLAKTDWLIILDQNLKSWDLSLQSASERLYFKNDDYRSIGIYSKNSRKFILGYKEIISALGCYSPSENGISNIVAVTRTINDDGLLSIVSHGTNHIFDKNHGKGSLGLAIAALRYKMKHPNAVLVGLDTQLAQQWLAEREDGKLPDLIGITFDYSQERKAYIDLIEVKTYDDYTIDDEGIISGHAVQQAGVLEGLIREMFGRSEKITTIARREILREQVFEYVFGSDDECVKDKQNCCNRLNALFAGECIVEIKRNINRIDFDDQESCEATYCDAERKEFILSVIAAREIQAIIMGTVLSNETVKVHENSLEIENQIQNVPKLQEQQSTGEIEVDSTDVSADIDKSDGKEELVITDSDLISENEKKDLHEKCIRLNVVLKNYGIHAKPVDEEMVQRANRFTRFEIELMPGETEANLNKRKEDIARELESAGEIFISRINGTRYIAIDVPFPGKRGMLLLSQYSSLLDRSIGQLDFVAGQEPDGKMRIVDLETAPHMLVAGTTGSGKSVFLNSIIVSLAETHSTDELEMILVDPKQMEFYYYEGLPHLRNNKILTDPIEAIKMLEHVRTVDIPERIIKIQSSKSKTILQHNERRPDDKLNYLVIIIDEYSALVNAAALQGKKVRDEFEKNLCTMVFMARAYGIHLIVATQYPTATYVTSALKSNLPFRVSFRLPSHTDSMTILDRTGAEDLLGNGDMLLLSDEGMIRMQGCYVSEDEIEKLVEEKKIKE